jgi:hypothetical protein
MSEEDTTVGDGDITRRALLGLAGAGGVAALAGCSQFGDTGITVSENGTVVADGVSDIDLARGLTAVDGGDESVSIGTATDEGSLNGVDPTLGSVSVDALSLGTDEPVTFGDDGQVEATFDSTTGRLEISGSVQTSDGDLKGPYDTNNYVHDMLLPGMDANATDAVGVQDNVLGYADEWASVSHTPFSDGGETGVLFAPGPSGWAGWNRFEDFPATVTVEGLSEDWAPGRAMAIFRDGYEPGRVTLETRRADASWEVAAEASGGLDTVVVLDPEGASTPVTALRWTFGKPDGHNSVRVSNLFYYSMSIKGNTWLPKARGETTGITFLPREPPDAPDRGAVLYADAGSGDLLVKRADGETRSLGSEPQSVAASDTVTLREGSAVVDTGVTEPGRHLNVHLDPTGGGANGTSVSVAASVLWDDAAGEYRVRIREDGTDVGNPTVGYRVTVDPDGTTRL